MQPNKGCVERLSKEYKRLCKVFIPRKLGLRPYEFGLSRYRCTETFACCCRQFPALPAKALFAFGKSAIYAETTLSFQNISQKEIMRRFVWQGTIAVCLSAMDRPPDPVPYCAAKPSPSNILEWHFVIDGPPDTDYEGGVYHGKIIFPPDYPFRPPGILFTTPSGRFHTNQRVCFSFSDFHPEAWNPMWNVATILNGVLSFMTEESSTTVRFKRWPGAGSMKASRAQRRAFAEKSLEHNYKSPAFRSMFPGHAERHEQALQREEEAHAQAAVDEKAAAQALSTGHVAQGETNNGSPAAPQVVPGTGRNEDRAGASGLSKDKVPADASWKWWVDTAKSFLPSVVVVLALGVMAFPYVASYIK